MKKNLKNPKSEPSQKLLCGVLSKREAVATIGGGCRHVHSTALGTRDPAAKQTSDALAGQKVATYAWEPSTAVQPMLLGNSIDRAAVIQKVIVEGGIEKKRFLREKVSCVLEELITNALYHAYRNSAGSEKYARRKDVTLASQEVIEIRYQVTANGIYLSVSDKAGSLTFDDVARSLWRCYETSTQIESKESGAGLGTYMVFDAVTHLKFETKPGAYTIVSCWIADQRSYDPEAFSFNYFERR